MCRALAACLLLFTSTALAGGGVVLRDDTCIITIGFYEAHFTAYQPATRGDEEFCEDLPDADEVLIVLDYLHPSLKQVSVDLRLIENATGVGEFAREPEVEALGDLTPYTVFYQPPVVREDGRFMIRHRFDAPGEYIGIVTAGHPDNDKRYTSVFPFEVGRSTLPWGWLGLAAVVLGGGGFLLHAARRRA